MPNFQLFCGDSLEQLKNLPDNSVDSIVCDPPYGLAFMGKKWDYDVPSQEVWEECLRVLKPGGHLLAFAGTRTQHRMAVRIEDAGFEIRDMIAWVYGSGFPKSMDVSKALDKLDANETRTERALRFTSWLSGKGVTPAKLRQVFKDNKTFSTAESCSTRASEYLNHAKQKPKIPQRHVFEVIRPHVKGEVPTWVEELVDWRTVESENFKRREVVGTQKGAMAGWSMEGSTKLVDRDITVAHTPLAKQWQGWGTCLKPALEPITLARKPLIGTVADNVLTHGTGAINVDGCRVGSEGGTAKGSKPEGAGNGIYGAGLHGACEIKQLDAGRFPANLIHDGSEEVLDCFPHSFSGSEKHGIKKASETAFFGKCKSSLQASRGTDGLGSAARFFYCAKASNADREAGLEGGEGNRKNHHPTVKPTDLMRYLCRLITPPGGTVLDPFMGSGSTGKAAMLEGFNFIGVDLSQEYVDISRARIEHARNQAEEKAPQELLKKQKPKLF